MGTILNRSAYQRLVDEDLEWLAEQPRGLERGHIEQIVRESVHYTYDEIPEPHRAWVDVHFDGNADSEREAMKTSEHQTVAEVTAPVETYKIPSRADHNRFIRNIWKFCIGAAIGIFLVTGSIMLALFLKGHDSKKIVEVSTTVFQVLVLSYGMGFFVPAFLTSLFKMSLGVEMSREALTIGQATAGVLDKLDKAVESRMERADKLFEKLEKATGDIDHPWVRMFKGEMEALRDTILNERLKAEDELDKALAEGEARARSIAAAGPQPPG